MKKIAFQKHSASTLLKNRTERFIIARDCSDARLNNNYLQFYSNGSSPSLTKASSKTSRGDLRPQNETEGNHWQLSNIYMNNLFSKKQTPVAATNEPPSRIAKDTSASKIEETLKRICTKTNYKKKETIPQSRSSRLLELKTSPAHRVSKDYFLPPQTSSREDPSKAVGLERRKAGLRLTLLPSRSFAKIPIQAASSLNNSSHSNLKQSTDRESQNGSASKHRKAATFDRAKLEMEIETIYENREEDSHQPHTALQLDLKLGNVKQDLPARPVFPKKHSDFSPSVVKYMPKKQSETVLHSGKENALTLDKSLRSLKQKNNSFHLLTKHPHN
jgi:hypothetical protein